MQFLGFPSLQFSLSISLQGVYCAPDRGFHCASNRAAPLRLNHLPVAVATLLLMLSTLPASAQRLICDGEAVDGWHFYCDPEPLPEAVPEPEAEPHAPEPLAQDAPLPEEPMTATEQIEAFRKHADELKHRAILEPTAENLRAYMEVNREMAQMAGRFAAAWQRVLFNAPHLDANIKHPRVQIGEHIYQDQKLAAEKAALQRAASEAGFLFIYEDPQYCRICLAQAQILDDMRREYGIEILAVSADGSPIEYFPDAVTDQGQLEALGLQDHPRPFIVIVDPRTGESQLIGGGLLSRDQILDRVYVVREVPFGERYAQ